MPQYLNLQGIITKISAKNAPDLVITILTQDNGKIVALAKSIKKIKSRRLGTIQLGNIITAQIYQKNDFHWLAESRAEFQFLRSKKNLTQLNLLFYVLEIINHFIAENQQIPGVYPVVDRLIKAISLNNFPELIRQEIGLLEILGFGIPPEISRSYRAADFPATQKFIRHYLESIIDRPLESNKLFR